MATTYRDPSSGVYPTRVRADKLGSKPRQSGNSEVQGLVLRAVPKVGAR